jgi:uncharacterized protein
MKARQFDPRRLDVEVFAKHSETLEGAWPLAAMQRLHDCCHPQWSGAHLAAVRWLARGEPRTSITGEAQTWLHLAMQTELALVCQRCLGPVDTPLRFETTLRFVRGEEAAAELDADSDEDVLALTRALDLQALVEDELLLSLPLVPRHEGCSMSLPADDSQAAEAAQVDPASPFAALSVLKQRPSDAQ